MHGQALVAVIVFLLVYGVIVTEKIHRTIIAMAGAALIVAFGVIDQETAVRHIDFNTLGLLIGMMIVVSVTAQTGLFNFVAVWAAKRARGGPIRILVALGLLTALFSAFLDNVTTVLLMAPVSLSIAKQLDIDPKPYLLAEIFAANIGGTATLIGDPPNIMIGSENKELTFMAFIANLGPVCLVILAVTIAILAMVWRGRLRAEPERMAGVMKLDERAEIVNPLLLRKCVVVLGLTIVGFFIHSQIHLESATVALSGAFLLLLISGERYLEESLTRVEWMTIFFFIGLFILVAGLVETGIITLLAEQAMALTGGELASASMLVLWLSAIASAFIDNIPFVATMIPLVKNMGELGISNLEPLWWSLALGACLGGNGTLIGASANVIVAGIAAKEGHPIRFLAFLAIGFPLMVLSVGIATVYIYLRYL